MGSASIQCSEFRIVLDSWGNLQWTEERGGKWKGSSKGCKKDGRWFKGKGWWEDCPDWDREWNGSSKGGKKGDKWLKGKDWCEDRPDWDEERKGSPKGGKKGSKWLKGTDWWED